MNTVVLKFGGSSVKDNIKLNVVAQKIIEIKQNTKNVVVVVSAQGKTTDNLIKEAQELSAVPEEREMDMLLSTGEQITAAKLSILLNRKGYLAISLTGWQAGIKTNKVHKNAKIDAIYTKRILEELKNGRIVIVAGFQGINEENDITTLGRGGSDTTAVAIGAAINAEKCYIYSDVDGIYSADPKIVDNAKKLTEISFEEMQVVADAGAKVLHNRCIQIGEKFNCDIVAKSTFSDGKGTRICKKIENAKIKSIVRNDNLKIIKMEALKDTDTKDFFKIYKELLENNIILESFNCKGGFEFRIQKSDSNKVIELLEKYGENYNIFQKDITKLSIVGYSITQDNTVLNKIIQILERNKLKILDLNLMQSKIEILLEFIDNSVIKELHENLIY